MFGVYIRLYQCFSVASYAVAPSGFSLPEFWEDLEGSHAPKVPEHHPVLEPGTFLGGGGGGGGATCSLQCSPFLR